MRNSYRPLTVLTLAMLALTVPAVFAAPVSPSQLTSTLHWRSVGPYVGGRVTALGGIPNKPNVLYMGTAGGGVWETEDYGHHWKPLTDKYFKPDTHGSVGALEVAPSNPKIIYVGSGDTDPRNTVTTGAGIYKSTDGGKTWANIGLNDTRIISSIKIDPNNPDIVYVGALGHLFGPSDTGGVYETTDGGQTWKKILYVKDGGDTGVISMTMDPSNPQVLYVGMWQVYRRAWTLSSGGPGSGIYKTTDGGAHWTNITHNQGLPKGIFGRIGLDVAPSEPNVVYALIQAKVSPGHPGGLYRSDNGGQSWTLMNDSLDVTQRAFYYMRVSVDPKDPNTVYLPNVDVYVSHDSGKTLIALHPPHGDNHVFWINPDNPQILVEGNDGGASVSLNGGMSWSSEDNQPTGQFYHVNLDNQFPFHIYGAQQDEGSAEGPSAVRGGSIPPVWTRVGGGEETWVVPTPGRPWVTYGAGYYSQLWRTNRRTDVQAQVNPWGEWKFGSGADQLAYRFGWWHEPMAFLNPTTLLKGANVLFKSTDEGFHWSVISPDLTRNDKSKQARPGGPINADVTGEETFDTISAISPSPLNQNIIWTGSDDGLVYVTTDGGTHWNKATPSGLPTWSTITSVEPSHTDPATAYVTADRYMWDDYKPYVYKTTDYGQHWTEIISGLPNNEYTEAIRQDPDDPSLMFVATSATVYMSLDGGNLWEPLTLNLPVTSVTDLEIQPEQHAVVISTFGRAFWVLDNLQFLEQLSGANVSSDDPYLFKPQQTWLVTRSNRSFGGGAGGQNLATGATVFFHLPADYSGNTPVTLSFTDASGKVINTYKLPLKKANKDSPESLHAGMNRFQWNLRYPSVVDVKGIFESSHSQGPKPPIGPEVVPGTYYAVLSYSGTTQKQPFVVKLDPRLNTTQAQLDQRFDLLMKIRDSIGRLDTALNGAIDARSTLEQAIASKSVSGKAAQGSLANLNRDINDLIDLRIQSDEGSLVYAGKLRAWLSWLAGDIEASFTPVTPAFMNAANTYFGQEREGVARLKADVAHVEVVVH